MIFLFKGINLFITIFLVCSYNNFVAQIDRKVDSLNTIIQNSKVDSIKVITMLRLSYQYANKKEGYTTAIETAQNAIKLAIKCNYNKGKREAYFTLGELYLYINDFILATKNFMTALVLYETQNDSAGIGRVYNNLGVINNNQHNYELALYYYKKSLKISQSQNNKKLMASTLHNMGYIYYYKTQYTKAKEFYLKSLQFEKEVNNTIGVAETYQCLGNIALEEKKTDEALKFYNRVLTLSDSINDKSLKVVCLTSISETFIIKKQNKEAILFIKQALELSEKFKIDTYIEALYDVLIKTHETAGEWREAFKYQKKLMTIRNSLYDSEVAEKTAEVLTKYETVKKEKNILLLEQEKASGLALAEKRKLLVIVTLVSALLLATLLLFILFRNSSQKKHKQIEFERSLLQFEQQALRAQMNPHFIFNAINSIQKYILKKQEQDAYDYLAKFAKLIRMVLSNSQDFYLMLDKELEMIKLHVELEQLRFRNKFNFNVIISENVNINETEVPAMLIQPYVENAIAHGLMNLENERFGILNINITEVDEILKIVIEDNGIGREKAKKYKKADNHKSIGMALTEQRLMMINKMQEYESAKVVITDLYDENKMGCGTKVEIFLPLILPHYSKENA